MRTDADRLAERCFRLESERDEAVGERDELREYAVELVECLRLAKLGSEAMLEHCREHDIELGTAWIFTIERIDRALAANPNPAGLAESSSGSGGTSTGNNEAPVPFTAGASGPVGLGPCNQWPAHGGAHQVETSDSAKGAAEPPSGWTPGGSAVNGAAGSTPALAASSATDRGTRTALERAIALSRVNDEKGIVALPTGTFSGLERRCDCGYTTGECAVDCPQQRHTPAGNESSQGNIVGIDVAPGPDRTVYQCSKCGQTWIDGMHECPSCLHVHEIRQCPYCGGTGTVVRGNICLACEGTGKTPHAIDSAPAKTRNAQD